MKRKAFTLIELLVVISVMIILMAMMLPAIKSMTRNNSQKQAVNQITSLLANARTTAVVQHKLAGLVIYEDPELVGQSSTQLIVLSSTAQEVTSSGSTVTLYRFNRAPRSGPITLPKGITVAMLDDSGTTPFRTSDSSTNTKARVILFDGNGHLVLMNSLTRDPSLTDASSAAWNLNADRNNLSRGVSSPAVVVFSGTEMKDATDRGVITNASTRAEWVKQNGDVLVVNAYTGNIIR